VPPSAAILKKSFKGKAYAIRQTMDRPVITIAHFSLSELINTTSGGTLTPLASSDHVMIYFNNTFQQFLEIKGLTQQRKCKMFNLPVHFLLVSPILVWGQKI